MPPMNSRIVMLLTVLIAIFVTAANAQVRTTGQIVGTVRDSTGAVIPDAEIQIRDLATGITADTRSARDGGFVFVAVQPGRYALTAVAKGFQPVVIESVNVEISRATNLTIQCEIAGIQEQVQVQGQTTLIETSSTTTKSVRSGFVWLCTKPIEVGSNSNRRWMVLASNPVVSVRRLAARPVGAHSNTSIFLAWSIWRILVTIVVFPTPGPPVITATLL